MRRKTFRTLLAGGAALGVAVIAGFTLAPDLRADSNGVSPVVLKRIAQKNDRAAMEAAARMRERSRVEAKAADSRLAAEERGRIQAEKMLARAGPVADNAPPANN